MILRQDREICLHLGEDPYEYHRAVIPPIYETSLFVFSSVDEVHAAIDDSMAQFAYTRGQNPTVQIVEAKLAALEQGESCKCFASGIAAITSTISALVTHGDHILFINEIYGPTLSYAKRLGRYGVTNDVVHLLPDDDVSEALSKAVKPTTKLIYTESPSTCLFKVVDLHKITSFAKAHGILTAIDNTWATPLFQKPLTFGFDICLHSCSKYIGGHSDVVAGAVITSKELLGRIFDEYMLHGATLGPFEAWLVLRGIRTLPERMAKFHEQGQYFAQFLNTHKRVLAVHYPGLPSDEGHALAQKQLTGYSSLMSFELDITDFDDIRTLVKKCRIFKCAVSWGGFESLILPMGRKEDSLSEQRLVRVAVGLEDMNSLIEDLNFAMA